MQSQKTSFIKRAGQGARREFQLMHLAVFPFQLEFLKLVDYQIVAYFEKGHQIIGVNGDSPILSPGGSKGDKQRIASAKNTIRFHLYSESNVVYKWSLYKRHPSGEEEFLESCAFNLRQVVANYILPHRDDRPIESVLPNDFHEKQLRGKFVKAGLILSFALMLATDASLIDSYVEEQFCRPASQRRISDNIIDLSNGDIVPKEEETLGEDSFQSASMLSDALLRNDSNISNPQPSPQAQRGLKIEPGLESEGHQEEQLAGEIGQDLDLDQLIIQGAEERVVVRPPPNRKDEDLAFGVEEPEEAPAKLKVEETKKLRHSNSRDYSLLKLDSDQGRQVPVEEIDARLGKEELDLIEEEKNSIKETARLSAEPRPVRKGIVQTGRADEGRSSVIVEGMGFKRILLILVVVACAFLVAATYRYNFRKAKGRPRSK